MGSLPIWLRIDGDDEAVQEAALRIVPIYEAILREREFQTEKYGEVVDQHGMAGPGGHDLTGWLLVLDKELAEAKTAATGHGKRTATGRNTTRAELIQIAAVCVAALEQHGLEGK